MKYMHFVQSCSYAALANMLMEKGVDVEDFEIAIKMKLPYLFQYSKGERAYRAGAGLQGKKWFDSYLNSVGLTFVEKDLSKENTVIFLSQRNSSCMLGLNMEVGKHALVYQGAIKDKYVFLNNKHQGESSPNQYILNKNELLERLDEINYIGWIELLGKVVPIRTDEEIVASLEHLAVYKDEVCNFCHKMKRVDELKEAMNRLFSALFLHLPAMMQLIQNKEIELGLIKLRTEYLNAMRKNEGLFLSDYMDLENLKVILQLYVELLNTQLG